MIEIPDSGPWKRIERVGDAVLILGDSIECVRVFGPIDAILADPQYGIGIDYDNGSTDDRQHILNVALPVIEACREISPLVSVTPGNVNHYLYPPPNVDAMLVQSRRKRLWALGVFMLAAHALLW